MSKHTIPVVTLTAYNMGPDATEADYDAWVAYVSEHLDERTGYNGIVVDQMQFDAAAQSDRVTYASNDEDDAIRAALRGLWEDFCADVSAWPASVEVELESATGPRATVRGGEWDGDTGLPAGWIVAEGSEITIASGVRRYALVNA